MTTRVTYRAFASLAVLLAFTAPGNADAQRADELPSGARVRVHRNPPTRAVEGFLSQSDSAGLTLVATDGSRTVFIPASSVAQLDWQSGMVPPGAAYRQGLKRGALFGLAVSAGLMATAFVAELRSPCQDCMINAPLLAALVGVPFTVGSTLIGGAVGHGQREIWSRVPYP